eukprot:TRINITY_DN1239_c0_g2_i3.p1 TRINITY_DN1239_c0_g2~~TRINITY_DN1239_c0_g2_i3.p1  ORF type:complete len:227 (-),score=44.92 TRINITY_DN1239_c0_g2_i3:196-876(-)
MLEHITWIFKVLLLLNLSLQAEVANGLPPRQPKDTYLQAPEVPIPPNFSLKDLLAKLQFSDLDTDSDGFASESEFKKLAEQAMRKLADETWKAIDVNEDGNLDLQELSAIVQKSWKEKVKKTETKRIFRPPVKRHWSFIWVLAKHYAASDLSRHARVSVKAIEKEVKQFLQSVVFLDERKAVFDSVAGESVGDEDAGFSQESWNLWRQQRNEGKKESKSGKKKTEL